MADKNFEYSFIEQPNDALKCSICLEIAKGQPMQHGGGCGRLFCEDCIEKIGSNSCPLCRGINPQFFPDSRSLRDIKSLGVRCDNVDRGCEWTGTVGTLEDHVAECGYTLVECTNKCRDKGESIHLMRKDLNNHIKYECPDRAYECEFCNEQGTYTSITEYHDLLCMKKPIPCRNFDCTLTVERGGVEEHVASECEHTIVACKYSNIGCPERKKRKDIKIHEEDYKVHLSLSLNMVSQLANAVTHLTVVVNELAEKYNGRNNTTEVIPNVSTLQKNRETFYSIPFVTFPNAYQMCLSVYVHEWDSNLRMSLYTELLEIPYKDRLKWPFRGTVIIKLLNQLEDKNHLEVGIIEYNGCEEYGRPGGGLNYEYFSLPLWTLTDKAKYLVDDALHLSVTVHES